jgi:hypothetical protein
MKNPHKFELLALFLHKVRNEATNRARSHPPQVDIDAISHPPEPVQSPNINDGIARAQTKAEAMVNRVDG